MSRIAQYRRNDSKMFDAEEIVPETTESEHLQRVEEWTQKSNALPPSNSKKSPKQYENEDHEAKSQLIIEAVKLLDTRDRQIRTKPPPLAIQTADLISDKEVAFSDRFRSSRQSPKDFVKDYEDKISQKKAYESLILNSYPVLKSNKNLLINRGINEMKSKFSGLSPVLEPDSWRFKASRSVKFALKQNSSLVLNKLESDGDSDERWALKRENDRDWWRWKLKQGFMQNDELLQKLVTQRHKLEASLKQADLETPKHNLTEKSIPSTSFTSSQISSRHVAFEIPALTKSRNKRLEGTLAPQPKTRDPIPNFYTPSKHLISVMTTDKDKSTGKSSKQKIMTLKKDPYLAKLLAGNEMFKPETMVDVNQPIRRRDLSQHTKTPGNVKRKISLESLSDSEDELIATNFFNRNRDVKVLFERLSEMETPKNNVLRSREPSDGYMNLPMLLATGRFNRYNKIPSMKLINNETTKRRFNRASKVVDPISKFRSGTSGHPATSTENDSKKSNIHGNIEDLPLNEWAEKVVSKFKKPGKMEHEGTKSESPTTNGKGVKETTDDDVLYSEGKTFNSTKPIDQETNMLYHDILMSKWKKGKHETAVKRYTSKMKRDDYDNARRNFSKESDKPKGLDIWLENIREKAKRDRLISPGNLDPIPSLVTAFENAEFTLNG